MINKKKYTNQKMLAVVLFSCMKVFPVYGSEEEKKGPSNSVAQKGAVQIDNLTNEDVEKAFDQMLRLYPIYNHPYYDRFFYGGAFGRGQLDPHFFIVNPKLLVFLKSFFNECFLGTEDIPNYVSLSDDEADVFFSNSYNNQENTKKFERQIALKFKKPSEPLKKEIAKNQVIDDENDVFDQGSRMSEYFKKEIAKNHPICDENDVFDRESKIIPKEILLKNEMRKGDIFNICLQMIFNHINKTVNLNYPIFRQLDNHKQGPKMQSDLIEEMFKNFTTETKKEFGENLAQNFIHTMIGMLDASEAFFKRNFVQIYKSLCSDDLTLTRSSLFKDDPRVMFAKARSYIHHPSFKKYLERLIEDVHEMNKPDGMKSVFELIESDQAYKKILQDNGHNI